MYTVFKKIIILVVYIMIMILFIVFPYLKAEYFTKKYGYEFDGLEKQTSMLDESDYHKVIKYSSETAIVLYVSESSKNEITFIKDGFGSWTMQNWRTIWSKTGSADELYWPYYK